MPADRREDRSPTGALVVLGVVVLVVLLVFRGGSSRDFKAVDYMEWTPELVGQYLTAKGYKAAEVSSVVQTMQRLSLRGIVLPTLTESELHSTFGIESRLVCKQLALELQRLPLTKGQHVDNTPHGQRHPHQDKEGSRRGDAPARAKSEWSLLGALFSFVGGCIWAVFHIALLPFLLGVYQGLKKHGNHAKPLHEMLNLQRFSWPRNVGPRMAHNARYYAPNYTLILLGVATLSFLRLADVIHIAQALLLCNVHMFFRMRPTLAVLHTFDIRRLCADGIFSSLHSLVTS